MLYQWYYLAPDVVSDDDEHVPQRREDIETLHLRELLGTLDKMLEDAGDSVVIKTDYMKIGLELKILEQLNMQTATMTNLLEEFRKLARMVSS
jgi:hypothetical protein